VGSAGSGGDDGREGAGIDDEAAAAGAAGHEDVDGHGERLAGTLPSGAAGPNAAAGLLHAGANGSTGVDGRSGADDSRAGDCGADE
jgi:hypothetical protein